jgi:Putative prokaryotic signal transducing protein
MQPRDILDDFDFDENAYLEGEEAGTVVAKYLAPLEADIAAARLRAMGIPCFLANVNTQSVMPHLQTVIRLHVRQDDADKARAILGEAGLEAAEIAPSATRPFHGKEMLLLLLLGIALILGFLTFGC